MILILTTPSDSITKSSIDLPTYTPWAIGLPDPIAMEGGSFYATALKRAIHLRLKECETLPMAYSDILQHQKLIYQKELLLERERTRTKTLQSIIIPDEGWAAWEVVLLVGGVAVGGIITGILIGAVGITVYR